MLRTLLEERFYLRVRNEPRQESVWNLVVAKGGLKMPVHDPSDKDYPAIHGQSKRAPDGSVCPGLQAQNVSMDSFVRALTRLMGRAVFDKTDLPARYDLDVIFRGESPRVRAAMGAFHRKDGESRLPRRSFRAAEPIRPQAGTGKRSGGLLDR
jgi:uncharacterized protein (TIGR03435 family)